MKRILLVDDEEDFCYFIKVNLEEVGDFEVFTCTDSTDAVRQTKKLRPDLILLDLVMPNKSGSEISEELKHDETTREIPVIFLTGLITQQEVKSRQQVGREEYFIAKPVEIEELKTTIIRITGT